MWVSIMSVLSKIEEVMTSPALKILARCSQQELSSDEMLGNRYSLELKDVVTVTHSNPSDSLLEISALGVSKGMQLLQRWQNDLA